MSELKNDPDKLGKISSSLTFVGVFNFSMFWVAFFILFNFVDDLTGLFPLYIRNLGIFLLMYFIIDLLVHINYIAVSMVIVKQFGVFISGFGFILSSLVFRYELASSFFDFTIVKYTSYVLWGSSSTILFGIFLVNLSRSTKLEELKKIEKLGNFHALIGAGLLLFFLPFSSLPIYLDYLIYTIGLTKVLLLPLLTGYIFMKTGNQLRRQSNTLKTIDISPSKE